MPLKIISVVETRVGLFKAEAICAAIRALGGPAPDSQIQHVLVHMGQANSSQGCDLYFNDIDLPKPDLFLGVSAAAKSLERTATISERFSDVLLREQPEVVMATGDSDASVECALTTKRIGYQGGRPGKSFVPALALVEAGRRNHARTPSREVNRVILGLLADYLFTPGENAASNLLHEGVSRDKVHCIGSLKIDTLLRHRARAMSSSILTDLQLVSGSGIKPFALLTLQHLSGAEGVAKLHRLQRALGEIARRIRIVLPAGPAALRCIQEANLDDYFVDHFLDGPDPWDARMRIRLIPPLGYLDFVRLMAVARVVLTDSKGIQEESRVLGIPCFTLAGISRMEDEGSENVLAGTDARRIIGAFCGAPHGEASSASLQGLDGRAAQRAIEILLNDLAPGG